MKNPYLASIKKHVQTEVRKSMVSDMLKIMIPPAKKEEFKREEERKAEESEKERLESEQSMVSDMDEELIMITPAQKTEYEQKLIDN
jgi:guanylate kinase